MSGKDPQEHRQTKRASRLHYVEEGPALVARHEENSELVNAKVRALEERELMRDQKRRHALEQEVPVEDTPKISTPEEMSSEQRRFWDEAHDHRQHGAVSVARLRADEIRSKTLRTVTKAVLDSAESLQRGARRLGVAVVGDSRTIEDIDREAYDPMGIDAELARQAEEARRAPFEIVKGHAPGKDVPEDEEVAMRLSMARLEIAQAGSAEASVPRASAASAPTTPSKGKGKKPTSTETSTEDDLMSEFELAPVAASPGASPRAGGRKPTPLKGQVNEGASQ